jgi:hypothetical protein
MLGPVAAPLAAAGCAVVDRLTQLPWTPDVMHGQHKVPSDLAAAAFPDVPMLFLCHGALPREEETCRSPNVRQYAAVDLPCRDRVASETGLAPESVHVLLNSVNLARFAPRDPLPPKPRRALLFSNFARAPDFVPLLRETCAGRGITLDTAGNGLSAHSEAPWELLPRYDLVFAKARCALEAMATGCAVVLCHERGVGPMVTSRNVEDLRPLNFGFRTLDTLHSADAYRQRIDAYDAADAARVTARIRAVADWEQTVDWLEAAYVRLAAETARIE